MCYGKLAQTLDNTEKYDPITPKLIKKIFQTDSQNMARIGNAIGWDQLERDAHHNADNPSEGVAKASVATGLGFLGAGMGSWLNGSQAASAAPAGVEGTMESALLNTGYTPSSLMNALQYGADSGQPWSQTMGNFATNKYNNAANAFKNGGYKKAAGKLAMNQAQGLLSQPQPAPSPMMMPQQQFEPPPPIYGELSEEEKRRLREQGYNIY